MATYVVSDIHGQLQLFEKLLDRIGFSKDDYLYVIGDAIDRGPDGANLLLKIMEEDNMDLLLGNHEFMMLNSIDPGGDILEVPGRDANLWLYYNGGVYTFEKYREFSLQTRKSLIDFLRSRKLTKLIEAGGSTICLTHSYFDRNLIDMSYEELDYNTVWDIVWNTPYRNDVFVPVSDYMQDDWQFIIGHVPVQRIHHDAAFTAFREQNITVIDGGCTLYSKGILGDNECGLICLRIDDMKEIDFPFSELGNC